MGFHRGPNIVRDGLVLALDAGAVRSYPGSGTTWYDLSGNGNNGTLTNGPTFSDGAIVFDGTNDHVLGTLQSSIFTGPHSINCWFFRETVKQWSGLFSNNVGTTSCSLLTFIDTSNRIGINRAGVSATSISIDLGAGHLNKWINCCMTISGVTNGSLVNVYVYMDGVLLTASGNLYWDMSSSSSYYIGRHWTSATQVHDGSIAQTSLYNRALTAEEVQQNYNALKGRFGL
jgi:hypothetical protein